MSDAGDAPLVYWWAPRGDDRVFDLSGWPAEPRQLARTLIEAAEVPHTWEGEELVVAAGQREDVQAILDEIVDASKPTLEPDEDRVAYELARWPTEEVALVAERLEQEGILHEWTGAGDLLVYAVDEERVDELFDELDLRGPDDGTVVLEGDELGRLLDELFMASDRLARHANDPDAVVSFARGAAELPAVAVPLGFDARAWKRLQVEAGGLFNMLVGVNEVDDEEVNNLAAAVRDRLRPWL